MRARWYDPELGRFLSEDPIGIKGGLNLYAFGGNDPINAKDPYGMCPPANFDITDCGDKPTEYWANVANNSTGATKAGATAAGWLTSLWTSDTWYKTAATLVGGEIAGFLRAGAILKQYNDAVQTGELPAAGETRVSRWMSEAEYQQMKDSGTLQSGSGGRTYVTTPGAPQPGGTGPVRVDFNVPTDALQPGGNPGWYYLLFPGSTPITGIQRIL